jgi:hypothetical protein
MVLYNQQEQLTYLKISKCYRHSSSRTHFDHVESSIPEKWIEETLRFTIKSKYMMNNVGSRFNKNHSRLKTFPILLTILEVLGKSKNQK